MISKKRLTEYFNELQKTLCLLITCSQYLCAALMYACTHALNINEQSKGLCIHGFPSGQFVSAYKLHKLEAFLFFFFLFITRN